MRAHADYREVWRGDDEAACNDGVAAAGEGAAGELEPGHGFEGAVGIAPVSEVYPGDANALGAAGAFAESDDAIGAGIGEGLEEDFMHDAEDCGGGADAEREGKDDEGGEAAGAQHGSEAVADILEEAFDG